MKNKEPEGQGFQPKDLMNTATILTVLLLCCLCGCAETNDPLLVEETTVNVVSVFPTPGVLITPDDTLIVTFDDVVTDLTASLGSVSIVGKQVLISGPYTNILHKEDYIINIGLTWSGGTQTLQYTVRPPDTVTPKIVYSPISDGDVVDISGNGFGTLDWDINGDGWIEIEFSEEVSGHISLQTERGEDVGWLGKVEGNKATLGLVWGKWIGAGMVYIITGKVSDAAGNELVFKIQFKTISLGNWW